MMVMVSSSLSCTKKPQCVLVCFAAAFTDFHFLHPGHAFFLVREWGAYVRNRFYTLHCQLNFRLTQVFSGVVDCVYGLIMRVNTVDTTNCLCLMTSTLRSAERTIGEMRPKLTREDLKILGSFPERGFTTPCYHRAPTR